MSEIIEQAINALHAYIPFLPAVKTGGEIRTLVQTRKQYAFYMLISASVVGHIQDRSYQYAP